MIIICCECKKKIGEKPPYESDLETHTWCDKCKLKVEEEIRNYRLSPQVELLATTSIDLMRK